MSGSEGVDEAAKGVFVQAVKRSEPRRRDVGLGPGVIEVKATVVIGDDHGLPGAPSWRAMRERRRR